MCNSMSYRPLRDRWARREPLGDDKMGRDRPKRKMDMKRPKRSAEPVGGTQDADVVLEMRPSRPTQRPTLFLRVWRAMWKSPHLATKCLNGDHLPASPMTPRNVGEPSADNCE